MHTSAQVLLFCTHIEIRNISRHFCVSDLCARVCVCVFVSVFAGVGVYKRACVCVWGLWALSGW